ncbi:hypothetical protein ACIQMR_33405 [Streptomyces sp. NPDC091376]|uniref:hypothetical protein n=1 Tax=Streptomyces sp. NPDC091376 TaxID=3365994 RepID=UPI003808377A
MEVVQALDVLAAEGALVWELGEVPTPAVTVSGGGGYPDDVSRRGEPSAPECFEHAAYLAGGIQERLTYVWGVLAGEGAFGGGGGLKGLLELWPHLGDLGVDYVVEQVAGLVQHADELVEVCASREMASRIEPFSAYSRPSSTSLADSRDYLEVHNPRYEDEDVFRSWEESWSQGRTSTWYCLASERVDLEAVFPHADSTQLCWANGSWVGRGPWGWVISPDEHLYLFDPNMMRVKRGEGEWQVEKLTDMMQVKALTDIGAIVQLTHHSTPMAGSLVKGAGMMTVAGDGRVTGLNDTSGHYTPNPGETGIAVAILRRMGLSGNVPVTLKGSGNDPGHQDLRLSLNGDYDAVSVELPSGLAGDLGPHVDPYSAALKNRVMKELSRKVRTIEHTLDGAERLPRSEPGRGGSDGSASGYGTIGEL